MVVFHKVFPLLPYCNLNKNTYISVTLLVPFLLLSCFLTKYWGLWAHFRSFKFLTQNLLLKDAQQILDKKELPD